MARGSPVPMIHYYCISRILRNVVFNNQRLKKRKFQSYCEDATSCSNSNSSSSCSSNLIKSCKDELITDINTFLKSIPNTDLLNYLSNYMNSVDINACCLKLYCIIWKYWENRWRVEILEIHKKIEKLQYLLNELYSREVNISQCENLRKEVEKEKQISCADVFKKLISFSFDSEKQNVEDIQDINNTLDFEINRIKRKLEVFEEIESEKIRVFESNDLGVTRNVKPKIISVTDFPDITGKMQKINQSDGKFR